MHRRLFLLSGLTTLTLPACAQLQMPPRTPPSLLDTARADPRLTTLSTALDTAQLGPTLTAPGPFTLLAPTDAAFAELPDGALDDLLKPENRDQLTAILSYHVLPAAVPSQDLTGERQTRPTLQGTQITLDGTGSASGAALMAGPANVIAADTPASNGLLHVIDRVLHPSQAPAESGPAPA